MIHRNGIEKPMWHLWISPETDPLELLLRAPGITDPVKMCGALEESLNDSMAVNWAVVEAYRKREEIPTIGPGGRVREWYLGMVAMVDGVVIPTRIYAVQMAVGSVAADYKARIYHEVVAPEEFPPQ